MYVKGNFLFFDDGRQVPFKKSPNHGGLKKSTRFLVIHYDGAPNATAALSWMLSAQAKVSAELWIGREGEIVQLVEFGTTAWHAGESKWKDVVGLNSHSIGIELQNSGTQQYTPKQLDVLVEASKAMDKEFNFEDIVGHSDIAPKRKIDPGKMFPMSWFKEAVTGELKNASNPTSVVRKTTTDVNVRKEPSADSDRLVIVPKGYEVNWLGESGGWTKVYLAISKITGWINSSYLK